MACAPLLQKQRRKNMVRLNWRRFGKKLIRVYGAGDPSNPVYVNKMAEFSKQGFKVEYVDVEKELPPPPPRKNPSRDKASAGRPLSDDELERRTRELRDSAGQ